MSLRIQRRAELTAKEIAGLDAALAAFYRNPPAGYYSTADQAALHYNSNEQPFHCDLIQRVFPSASVLEVGCGTAHLCPHIEARGAAYTGVDYSEALVADNRRRFPRARFFQLGELPPEQFDVVVSLYTIEHVADPPAYLDRLWSLCRPGGMLAIICPEFVLCPGLAPSLFFGRTPRRFRQKLKSFDLQDACSHLIDLKLRAVLWKRCARRGSPGAFWMNLRPRILAGAEFTRDTDAIHLVRLDDLIWFFREKRGNIVATSRAMPNVPADILKFNGYVVANKPREPAFRIHENPGWQREEEAPLTGCAH